MLHQISLALLGLILIIPTAFHHTGSSNMNAYAQVSTSTFLTYADPATNISIQYPGVWTVTHNPSIPGLAFVDSNGGIVATLLASTAMIGKDLKTSIEMELQNPASDVYKIIGINDTTINGKPAVQFEYYVYSAFGASNGDPNKPPITHTVGIALMSKSGMVLQFEYFPDAPTTGLGDPNYMDYIQTMINSLAQN